MQEILIANSIFIFWRQNQLVLGKLTRDSFDNLWGELGWWLIKLVFTTTIFQFLWAFHLIPFKKNWTLTLILMKGRQFWHLNVPQVNPFWNNRISVLSHGFYLNDLMGLSKWYVLKYTALHQKFEKSLFIVLHGWLINFSCVIRI